MSSKVIGSVLNRLKGGKVVGTKLEPSVRATNGATALKYRSYNASLGIEDFQSILPEKTFAVSSGTKEPVGFELIKSRDPRFFQFKDYYVLLFKDEKLLKEYYQATQLARIHKVRVKFTPLPSGQRSEHVYSHYVENLEAAFESSRMYTEQYKKKRPFDQETFDLAQLQQRVRPIEERSALVWNLPPEMRSHNLMDRFWFYDIKHCFKLYWDDSIGKTLYYVAFNDRNDCMKFKRNFHGVYFDDDPKWKLLVETLH